MSLRLKYLENIRDTYGSTDTGLAKIATQAETGKHGAQKMDSRSKKKVAYSKLSLANATDVSNISDIGATTDNLNTPNIKIRSIPDLKNKSDISKTFDATNNANNGNTLAVREDGEKLGSTRSLFTRRWLSKLAVSGGPRGTIPTLLTVKKTFDSFDSGTDVRDPDEPDGPNFDLLFESPDRYPMGLRTPKRQNSVGTVDSLVDIKLDLGSPTLKDTERSESDDTGSSTPRNQGSRRNSAMETTLTQILVKHYHSSGGLVGFRHRVANDLNRKYCSSCPCDDMIFLFLHVIFGIIYVSAGTLALIHCPEETLFSAYLLADGALCVFFFPITIVEWTRRVGGCTSEVEKEHGTRALFVVIVILRIAAAVSGTVILFLRAQKPPESEFYCHVVHLLLEVGVVVEWAFLLFVIATPLILYACAYLVAKTCLF